MRSSRGGHSAKDDDEKEYFKYMLDFEGKSMDFRTIIDIEKGMVAAKEIEENEYPEGVIYLIKITRNLPPYETLFNYSTAEMRDMMWEELRDKMKGNNTIFM